MGWGDVGDTDVWSGEEGKAHKHTFYFPTSEPWPVLS